MKTTDEQRQLVQKLSEARIEAVFNGDFLNCKYTVRSADTGRKRLMRFSFEFDDPSRCDGGRVLWRSLRGTYSDALARIAANIIRNHSDALAEMPIQEGG